MFNLFFIFVNNPRINSMYQRSIHPPLHLPNFYFNSPIKSIYPIPHSMHDPATCSTSSSYIQPNDPKKKEKIKIKKETNYVPSKPHTHPKAPFILLLIPFSDPRIRPNIVPPPPFQPPWLGRGDHARAILAISFPENIRGAARLNSAGLTRVKRNWPPDEKGAVVSMRETRWAAS